MVALWKAVSLFGKGICINARWAAVLWKGTSVFSISWGLLFTRKAAVL